jgi:hypothetical protein
MKPQTSTPDSKTPPRWRLWLGAIIFAVGFLSPTLIPLVAATKLPLGWKTALSGLLAVGIPEIFALAAVGVMGKAGFNYLKQRFFGFMQRHGPPDRVSRGRYHAGLALFVMPILFGWLAPYAAHFVPGYEAHRLMFSLAGDAMLVCSLFVLGGDFWDKVRALFIHGATAQIPAPPSP